MQSTLNPIADRGVRRPPVTRVLVLEDSPSDATLVQAEFHVIGYPATQVDIVPTLTEAQHRLRAADYDAVLIDLGLPDSDGLDTFHGVAEVSGDAALIVLSGQADDQLVAMAVHEGAQDFLVKGRHRPGELARTVDRAVRRQQLLVELRSARDEQLAAKDRFISHVSHELRSPLAVVHQYTALLLDEVGGPISDDQRDFLSTIMRNLAQLKTMVDDLLEVGRRGRGQVSLHPGPVHLDELVRQTVASYQPEAEHRGIALGLELARRPVVDADAGRLREVIANLLENALRFTRRGGHVTVQLDTDPGWARITVEDDGIGIAPEHVGRVFEQFYQVGQGDETGRTGLGLGLFVSKDLVERHGGEISVSSRPDRGSTFTVRLPQRAASPEER